MKKHKTYVVVFVVACAVLAAIAAVAAKPGQGRQQQQQLSAAAAPSSDEKPDGSKLVRPTAAVRERRAEAAPATPAPAALFAEAAERNNSLKYELDWAFGGKRQHGWYLYVPLISRLIETDAAAVPQDFAASLARWQKSEGLRASGVLDDETLYRMVSTWQGSRLKEKSPAEAHQLLLAPASDFYDPTRAEELRQVERETYAAYKRMVAAAVADPSLGLSATANGELAPSEKYLKIISSFRSRAYQERLRKASPHSGRAGLAVHSPHFTGRALDIYVGGEPVETKDSNRAIQVQTRAYKWLVKNAERFGFRPYYYEPWHWEYVGGVNADHAKVTARH
ncbi:MAG TPA: D-alanyl-D-alanine carboxypeptidase family protein [Pyrinomonadaceae bacterium]|nr:D-alanyl-D-alanine carboxypeptidase family protein [Pyrinomonadaceae bacterium]